MHICLAHNYKFLKEADTQCELSLNESTHRWQPKVDATDCPLRISTDKYMHHSHALQHELTCIAGMTTAFAVQLSKECHTKLVHRMRAEAQRTRIKPAWHEIPRTVHDELMLTTAADLLSEAVSQAPCHRLLRIALTIHNVFSIYFPSINVPQPAVDLHSSEQALDAYIARGARQRISRLRRVAAADRNRMQHMMEVAARHSFDFNNPTIAARVNRAADILFL
eukprot:1008488-Rhodomonas_salina.1